MVIIRCSRFFVSAALASGAWQFNYWTGSTWSLLNGVNLDHIMEELSGTEEFVFNIPNTSANQVLLGVDSPSSSNVYVQVLYVGANAPLGFQIFLGICTGATLTKSNIQCICYNPTYLALKQAPNLVSLSVVAQPANQVMGQILSLAGATQIQGGACPNTNVSLDINNLNAFDAIAALAKALNLDYWGSGNQNYCVINIGTRDATAYSDANFIYETTTQRSFDRSQQYSMVIVLGTDVSTGNAIQGQAGSAGGAVKAFVYSLASDIATLNSIAAYELSLLNTASVGNPLSVLTDTACGWHPGQYVTVNRSDLALVGTFEIQRITKGSILSSVEVEKALPRTDVNLKYLSDQINAVALKQT